MPDGIQFGPLTSEQKRRLDSNGNRVWTETEIRIMHSNLAHHDRVRNILNRRCGVKDCRFVLGGEKETYALPNFSDVCDPCYHMFYALKNARLKNMNYFIEIHDKWRRDNDPNDQRRKDRLGL